MKEQISPTVVPTAVGDDVPARMRVAQSILEHGPSTAAVLAERLDLTPAGVRRHLDQLLAEGLVEAREERVVGQRRRGRPAKSFALTQAGRDAFEHAYDDLALDALRFIATDAGPDAVARFAKARLAPLIERFESIKGDNQQVTTEHLAAALRADGFAASVSKTPAGEQLCQHHCPVAHVAAEFPQLCEAETELFSELLDSHVQRLATIAHGDSVCTTHVPHRDIKQHTERSTQ